MNALLTECLFADEALSWMDAPGNQAAWQELYQGCAWRFPTLSPTFYRLWLKHYGEEWDPLLVVAKDPAGRLAGLFPLATREGLVTGAGAHQAEYQGWLSLQEIATEFLLGALQGIQDRLPSRHIRLRYLAPATPPAVVAAACSQYPRAILTQHPRPLLRLDMLAIDKNLRKKGTKSKLNRLKRAGLVDFKRLTDIAQVREHLDSIIAMYDFRQGAANDSCPFLDDPNKAAFLLDWAQQSAAKELHISCLTLNDRAIAALVGVTGDAQTQLAILAYSPAYGACSPGKLQVYHTARMLSEQGGTYLDLTPGGDPWKERFATGHDTVMALDVYPSNIQAARTRLSNRLNEHARSRLRGLGVSPTRLKHLLRTVRRTLTGEFLRSLRPTQVEYRLYRVALQRLPVSAPDADVHTNDLRQLTLYDPGQRGPGRQSYLTRALAHLESGDRIYTIADNSRLRCSARLSGPRTSTYVAETEQNLEFPLPSHLIDDLYFHPQSRKDRDGAILLQRILSDLKEDGAEAAYLGVSTANMDDGWLKALGFKAMGSAHLSRRLWHKRGWQDIHLEDDA